MKRLLLLAIALHITALASRAGINSGMPDGYLNRGMFYYDITLNGAAVDQLSHYCTVADPDEQAELTLALAAARDCSPRALDLLSRFLSRYPQSAARHYVRVVIGNCLMDRHEWSEACNCYTAVPDDALDPSTDALRRLNLGIALMQSGRRSLADAMFTSLEGTSQAANARFYRGYIAYADGNYSRARTLLEGVTDTRMPAALAPFYLCQIYYAGGDNEHALSMARLLRSRSEAPAEYRTEATRIAGEALYNMGDAYEAIPLLRDYLNNVTDTPQPSALYILGMSEYEAGDYRAAIATLKSPSGLDDAMAQSALLTIGQSYLKLGEVQPAIIALNRAVAIDADPRLTEEASYNYCVARSDGGRVPFGNSTAVFESFVKRFPRSRYVPAVSEYLAYGYMNDDNYEAALASIDRIKNPSTKIIAARRQVLYTLGSRDLAAGRYDQAIRYLTEAQTSGDVNDALAVECDLLLGDCYYKKTDYAKAASFYNRYLARASKSAPNRDLAMYDMGYALFAQKKYDAALGRFEELVRQPGISPSMKADAMTRIADCHYAARRLDNAIRCYDDAAIISPSTADYPLYQRAVIYGWKGNQQALINGLDAMIDRFPSSPLVPQALLDIAEAHTAQGHINEAIDTYRRIERQYGNTAQCRQAMLLMGSLQSANGRADEAYDTFCRLISRHSPSTESTRAARYLQELAAQQDRLDEFTEFMASVPNAPAIDPSELDRATFDAARTPRQWEAYLAKYPHGERAPQALLLLARHDVAQGDNEAALSHASQLLADYPDGELAADALAIKADAEMALGMTPEALESYRLLEQRAADTGTLNRSRLGQLHAARDLGQNDEVLRLADLLLSSSSLGAGQQQDVSFIKAVALMNNGRGDEAVDIWQTLAVNPADLIGAKSLYYMAQYYYDTDRLDLARKTIDSLVDSGSPHSYWLARGYILLSDLYREQGDTFEAEEYLRTLKANYPGSEPDIFIMIDSRLTSSK